MVLGVVAALLMALTCIASAADRAGAVLPLGTPAWVAARSIQQHAAAALGAGRPQAALPVVARAIAADPAAIAPVSTLGSALALLSRPAEAHRAFTVAAARGWRDPATQFYWLAVATQVGDATVAAQRLDALLRIGTDPQQTAPLLAQLEQTAEGRTALAARIALNPQWAVNATRTLGDLTGPTLRRRTALLAAARAEGYRPNCAWLRAPASIVFDRGEFADAAMMWHGLCGARGRLPLLVDGGFDNAAIGRDRQPFEWTFLASGETEVQLAPAPDRARGHGQALSVLSASSTTQNVAAQDLVLPPGRYRLTGRASDGFRLRIDCRLPAGIGPAQGATLVDADVLPEMIVVPPQGCAAQRLTIQVELGGGPDRRWLDDVDIVRADG